MQLDLPFHTSLSSAEPSIDFVRVPRARKYILRVRPDGSVRVTVPRRGSRAEAVRFVERHIQWIVEERLRQETQQVPRTWRHGSTIQLHGDPVTIKVQHRASHAFASYADRLVRVPLAAQDLRPYIEADLRVLARETLVPRLYALASVHGLTVDRVSIRNQRSRWGSCSRSGRIALNFRLVQMPAGVSDYVLVHELMHLKQQNHGPRFWRLVEAACPDFRASEAWLKVHGRALF